MTRTIDRRSFLKLGAASAGATIACRTRREEVAADDAPPVMRYRQLGGTGLEVSEVAFGAHGIDNAPLMAAAVEAGINTFCTSGRYMDGREEVALGEALASIGAPRESIVILTGNDLRPGDTTDSLSADIDASLRRLRTDYIDVYYNAMVQTPGDVQAEVLFGAFDRARQAGKVRHLALSGHHGGMQACLEAGIEAGHYEVFFTKYDFVSYPDQDEILRRAASRGIGTMVFKVGAGNRQREIEDLEAGGLSFQQATIRWALANPDVASVAVALNSFDEIRECVAAVSGELGRAEVSLLRRYAGEMYDKYCRFCATCEASCLHQVAVAEVMRYAMYFTYYGREKEAMRLYRGLSEPNRAAACATCPGPCDGACPFGRKVRTGLVEAHERLSWKQA
jgi:aryl-alcohol dehydrogenase-like predicted oxidoreductase